VDEAGPLVAALRQERPEQSFTLSMRTGWDGLDTPADEIRSGAEAFAALGIQHLLVTPAQPDLDGWLRSADALWKVLAPLR
jgi:hypothetical protein